jgi:hypothetical protein
MANRDRQRARLYAWEDQFIAPHDRTSIAFGQAQRMVDAIWAEMGLRFPPKVDRLPRQARCTMADATRLSIRLPQSSPSWCLLHELAHALSSTHDGISDGHGPVFVGLYAQMLARYMRVPFEELAQSLATFGIEVDLTAKPVFEDREDAQHVPAEISRAKDIEP